jgi:hypothetical protein
LFALVDTPGQTSTNWDLIANALGYVPENVANKVAAISGASTDTQYPSAKLLYDQLAGKATTAQGALADSALQPAAIGTTVQAYDADLTTWAGITPGTGVGTALAVAVGSAGSPVVNGGAGGTPLSMTATNLTGTAAGLTAGNVTTNANLTGHVTSTGNAAVLGSFTVAQLNTAISDADVVTTATLNNGTLPASVTTLSASGDITQTGGQINFNSTVGALRFKTDAGLEKSSIRLAGDDLKFEDKDGAERIRVSTTGLAVTGALSATGIVTPGTFTTGTRPTKTLGGIIFDTTLNKLLIGGASAWEAVTSV